MLYKELSAVVLAGGKGSRMHSSIPKVLHPIGGKPMIQHVIDTVVKLGIIRIHIVYSCRSELLIKQLNKQVVPVNWVYQEEFLGTGHAVKQVVPFLKDSEEVLILYGDVPLISVDTLRKLLSFRPEGGISLLTVTLDDPDGYGRIIRDEGKVVAIIEQKDVNGKQRIINEINAGFFVTMGIDLKDWLNKLTNNNISKEFYLTDIVSIAYNSGRNISAMQSNNIHEIKGVNNKLQLSQLDRFYQKQQAETLLLSGVMIIDPSRFDLRGELSHGYDIYIDVNVIIEGKVFVGDRVVIGTGCFLKDVIIGNDVIIYPYTVMEGATVEDNSTVGPFSRLRPESKLEENVHVGNFVEIKKTRLGRGSKVSHLSYMGDADVGVRVNVGAGTIICNYDGVSKHRTIIGNDVFIGSDSQLVAPVNIGSGAIIGAGTTVTHDVSEGETIISRIRQFSINHLNNPVK